MKVNGVLFLSFLTFAVNVSGQPDALTALYVGKGSWYPTNKGLGLAAELVWVLQEYSILSLVGIELLSVQPVV